jgi:hypothetical protein
LGKVPAEAKNIIYEDLIMNGAQNPIIIDQSYGGKKKPRAVSKLTIEITGNFIILLPS